MPETLLETHHLSRSYREFQALKPTDLTLQAGQLVVLTGPNGSGKTTLLLCLSGLLRPTSGTILVGGFDLYQDETQVRQRLAYVPDVPVFYQELTAWEHLLFMAQAHRIGDSFEGRAEELLGEFGLWESRHLYPHAYSRGMRLKLGVVLALIRPFSVLLLDEPSSALDIESTAELVNKLSALSANQMAIMLTTHDPQFAQQLNAQVWHIKDGNLSTE
jgi:ABC-2 type transport system ATP-binding protein